MYRSQASTTERTTSTGLSAWCAEDEGQWHLKDGVEERAEKHESYRSQDDRPTRSRLQTGRRRP